MTESTPKGKAMLENPVVLIALAAGAWLLLQLVILPAFGVPT